MKLITALRSLIAAIAVFAFVQPALASRKIALVIGNGDYLHTQSLANPVNDAQAMSAKLETLGFETFSGFDLDKYGMERLLRDFARASRESDVNVFFYAGHGMSIDGTNFLVPVDAMFEDETAIDFEAVPVDFITRQMSLSNAVNLVFLDACRDNPLAETLTRSLGSTRSTAITRGLSEMKVQNAGKGMAIAFSTSPGEVALDGEGFNSPFTTALLKHIGAENADITEIFSKVTGDVYDGTGQQQRPWINASLTGPVILNPVEQPQPVQSAVVSSGATAGASDMLEEQKLLFNLARETGAVEDYQAYLDSFPNGLYANNARRTVKKLQAENAPVELASTRTSGGAASFGAANTIPDQGPLTLPVTAVLRNMPASANTEVELNLDRTKRGNIQARLNATGHNVGGVDGQWGGKTRRGISSWQSANGLYPTGYLNSQQYSLLVSQSDGRFTPYTAPKVVHTARKGKKSSSSRNNQRDNALGAAIVGGVIGAILSK